MRNTSCCIFYILTLLCNSVSAQNSAGLPIDTSSYYFWICKQRMAIPLYRLPAQFTVAKNGSANEKKLLLSVNGDASYDHFDRNALSDDLLLINSFSDIVTLRLNAVYKETYPFAFSFRYNKADPFQMDNQYELNLGFDNRGFRQLMQERVNKAIKGDFQKKYQQLYQQYEQVQQQYEKHKKILESPAYAQQEAEERLRGYRSVRGALRNPGLRDIAGNLPGLGDRVAIPEIDQLRNGAMDSVSGKLNTVRQNIHGRLVARKDSLMNELKEMEDSIARIRKRLTEKLDSTGKAMTDMASTAKLKKMADESEGRDTKGDKMLDILMRTNIRLGKFLLNNSELTVTNIFLHGASIKYGDEKFVMLSGGVYDFAFRQMFNFRDQRRSLPRTTVFAVKFGKTDGQNLSAATFYTGKKIKRGSVNDELETVAGVALERKFYFSPNFSFDVEVAKSTTLRNSPSDKDRGTLKDLFGTFSSKTIGVYSALNAYLPKTKTDIELGYRYWGQQFQSFNANQYFNPQNNFSGRLSQSLFKRRLSVSAGAKYTDFKSYGIASNMKTRTVFASFSSVLRIKRLPIISAGYYPGSQLYWFDQNRLYEYYYYIFNTSISHYFTPGRVPMQVVLTYTRFLNNYKDSVVQAPQYYYNLFWTAWKDKFSYSMNLSRSVTDQNRLHTIEGGLNYTGRIIKLGGSVKWNLMRAETGIGYSFNTGISVKKIGTINFIYDRSFLPDRTGLFIPVSMGQLQIIKPLKFSVWQPGR